MSVENVICTGTWEMLTMVSLFYVENTIRKALTTIHAENVIMTQDAALHINPKTMNATRLNGLRINTKLSEFIRGIDNTALFNNEQSKAD